MTASPSGNEPSFFDRRVKPYLEILTAVGAIIAIAISIATYTSQKNANTEVDRNNTLVNEFNRRVDSYQRDRDTVAGFSVHLSKDVLIIQNNTQEPILKAGYWILGKWDNDDTITMEQRLSTLTPIPPCKQFSIRISDTGMPDQARPNAAFLIYQNTPDSWIGISDEGAMEHVTNREATDPIKAIRAMNSYQVMSDTILEGVDENNEEEVDQGTGPANRDTSLYDVRNSVKATMTSIPCAR